MKKKILYFLLITNVICTAQKLSKRSAYEIKWAFFHPIAAIKTKFIYKKALPIYTTIKNESVLDNFENGGKLDAYRHVFFMAAFSQKINPKKIKKLGIAHEKGNYKHFLNSVQEHGELPDSLSTVMDLFNNSVGINLGKYNKKTKLNELSIQVINEINAGEMLYFKRDATGKYLTCSGNLIEIEKYQKKWFIPKCLIKSNEK